MIHIQRHIEVLLLSNDCVIVPDFGGFIAHHVEARYDADEKLWLPPFRTLGFNQQLRLNDSLLAQSYVDAYDMSYPDALRQIENEVEELKDILNSEGNYEMGGVGTLRVNSEGNLEFDPCEAGILSPEEYGLSDFSFKKLKDNIGVKEFKDNSIVAGEAETIAEEEEPHLLDFMGDKDEADDESRALVIKMSWVRNAVAIAAAIACFFLLAMPMANSNFGNQAMSQLNSNIINKLMPKDSNMTPAKPVEVSEVKEVNEVKEVSEVSEDKEVNEVKEVSEVNKDKEEVKEENDTYCIVLASQVKRSNAEEYVEKLKKRGIDDARIYIHNNILRVICGSFQKESEAYQQLNKMADEDEDFYEAWVYRVKSE